MPQNIYKSLGLPPELAEIADAEVRTPPGEDEGGGGGGLSPGGIDVKSGNGALDLTKGSHLIASGTSFTLADSSTDKDFHTIYNMTGQLVIISHKAIDSAGDPQAGSNIYLYSYCTAAVEWNDEAGGWVRRQAIQFPSAAPPQLVANTSQLTDDGDIDPGTGHWFLMGGDTFNVLNSTVEDCAITIRNNTGTNVTLNADFYQDDTVISSLILVKGAYLFLQWNQNKWIVKVLTPVLPTGYETLPSGGTINPLISHSQILSANACTLADGDASMDGYEKTIFSADANSKTVSLNFSRINHSGVGSNIVFASTGAAVRLQWNETISRWVVRSEQGTLTFNLTAGS